MNEHQSLCPCHATCVDECPGCLCQLIADVRADERKHALKEVDAIIGDAMRMIRFRIGTEYERDEFKRFVHRVWNFRKAGL